MTRDWPDWQARFMAAGVTAGAITRPQDHLDCPQVKANALLPAFEGHAELRTLDSPIRISGEQKSAPRMAPRIGEHTMSILEELGFASADIADMADSGAIGTSENG